MSIVLQSSGGGQITLQEPTTASNFTQTLPAATGSVALLDGSNNFSVAGNLSFNSGFGSAGVAYGCRAWVNFNGTGTVAIRGSGNVSSITDNGTGDYTVNMTNAMPDINYSIAAACSTTSGGSSGFINYNAAATGAIVAPTTTTFRLWVSQRSDGSQYDPSYVYANVFR